MDTKGDGCGEGGREKIYGPGSYCSCTRESAQLGEKREMGYRCTVSNAEAWTSIDTLRWAPLLHSPPKHQNLLLPFSPFELLPPPPFFPPYNTYLPDRGTNILNLCFFHPLWPRSFHFTHLTLRSLRAQRVSGVFQRAVASFEL